MGYLEPLQLIGTRSSLVTFRLNWTPSCREAPLTIRKQADRLMEVVNRSVETYLHCFVSDKPRQWLRWLPWAEYNTSFHTSAQTMPFQIVYGREPPRVIRYGCNPTLVSSVEAMLEERDAMLEVLKFHLLKA